MCWITASRPPCAVPIVYLTPTPGSRVSRRSTGTSSCLLDQSRGRKHRTADALGLLHQREADGCRREHVETRERDEIDALGGLEQRVLGRHLGYYDRELAVGDERGAGVQALPSREAADLPRDVAAAQLSDERHHDR